MSERHNHADEAYLAALRTGKPTYPQAAIAVAGMYRMRYPAKDSPWCAVKIVEICPTDDETGELIGDVTYEARVNGQPVATAVCWPYCGRFPIPADEYRKMMAALFTLPPEPASATQTHPVKLERPPMEAMPEAVATAVNTVMANVGYVQKRGENKFHGYKFAAIGDVLGKLQPAMAEAGLIVVQDEVSHALIAGEAMMEASYTFALIHKTGATWNYPARHTGLAGAKNSKGGYDDKALNKCHTAARKYFLMALFQIPTGEQDDPDHQEDQPAAPAVARTDNKLMAATEWANFTANDLDKATTVGYVNELMNAPDTVKRLKWLYEAHRNVYDIVERARTRAADRLTKAAA